MSSQSSRHLDPYMDKKVFLAHIQNLAEYLAHNSFKLKSSNTSFEQQKHHQSEKSSATVIDEFLTISAKETINTHHRHTSTITKDKTHHKKNSSIQVDKSFVSKHVIIHPIRKC